ncbi:MAG: hypothetical protein QE284_03390 [Rhizobium sp.]|nr:hypothetical protein [Rhizobium sp.]
MLGPVSAPTNLYQPVQDSRITAESRNAERMPAPTAAEPYAASAATTIAGNLNMMLLSAPERMSQNLVVLTEVLASVLKMKQEPNEPLTAFAARLIEAIATLPPADLQKLRGMLSDAFAGLQLRTLLQALRNPQGPEAATLAIYLELYRQKDRDPGARAVISSYRQNDETPLAQLARDPRAVNIQAQPSTTPPARQPAALPSTPAPPSGAGPLETVSTLPQMADADTDTVYGTSAALSRDETTDPAEGANLRALRQMRERIAAAGASGAGQASISDGPDPDRPITASAEPSPASKADRAPPVAMPSAEIADAAASAPANVSDAESTPVATKPKSAPATSPLPAQLLEDVTESELIRTLLALYATEDAPDVVNAALDALMSHEQDEGAAKLPMPVTAQQTADAEEDVSRPALERPVHLEERLALATSTASGVSQEEPARISAVGQGLPLVFVNYVIESEDESDAAEREEQDEEKRDDAEGDEDASDDGHSDEPPDPDVLQASAFGPATNDGEDRADLGLAAPRLDAEEALQALPSPDEDPALALYLRLSDFA